MLNLLKTQKNAPQKMVIQIPVKPGETIWDAQARIEKSADANKTVTGNIPIQDTGIPGIFTAYYRNDNKDAGSVFIGKTNDGKTFTRVIENDNDGDKSGTCLFDDNNDGTIDRKYRFCYDN